MPLAGGPPPNLLAGRRPSGASLIIALAEARQRSADNQEALQQAGEHGQELLAQEQALQSKLENVRAEICEAEDVEEDASTSQRPALMRQATVRRNEVDRVEEQIQQLVEELEDKERELSLKKRQSTSSGLKGGRGHASTKENALVERLLREVASAAASEREVAAKLHKEQIVLAQELEEAREQASGMIAVLSRKVEAVTLRNQELREELAVEQERSQREASSMEKAVAQVRVELEQWKAASLAEDFYSPLIRRRASDVSVYTEVWDPNCPVILNSGDMANPPVHASPPQSTASVEKRPGLCSPGHTPASGTSTPSARGSGSAADERPKRRVSEASGYKTLEAILDKSPSAKKQQVKDAALATSSSLGGDAPAAPLSDFRNSIYGLVDDAVLSLTGGILDSCDSPSSQAKNDKKDKKNTKKKKKEKEEASSTFGSLWRASLDQGGAQAAVLMRQWGSILQEQVSSAADAAVAAATSTPVPPARQEKD
eukprot:TRINITY_DN2850_c0_g2_i1.p1 TRINITY_DN2850_c0_g2~~TRINITY_DN2850_c0_g2_i1.p1  ORF type:complete len:487 (+),score=137.78 TRINITY_DN2850_c0_g2_i1:214-1674(+)